MNEVVTKEAIKIEDMIYEILLNLREEFHSNGRIDDSNAKLDEIIKIEIALGIPITTLIKSRFHNIKINNKTKYLKRLKQLRTD